MWMVLIIAAVVAATLYKLGKKLPAQGKKESVAEVDKAVVESAERMADIINESLNLAQESMDSETKVSRLDLAKSTLEILKDLKSEYPYLKLNNLEDVEAAIKGIESGFMRKSHRIAANGNERGRELEKEGRVDEAIREYEFLVRHKVDTPFPYRRLSILYSKRKQTDEEIRIIRQALKNVPKGNESHYRWFADRLAKKTNKKQP